MTNQEYTVKLSAETKQAKDKIDAVQNSLKTLTDNANVIRVNVDTNAVRQSAEQTREIANSIRRTTSAIKETSGINIVSSSSISSAASLASQFYGIRRDVKGINEDLGKALGRTNVSEFMRTEQFLDRVLENSRSRSREIVETYANIRELPGVASALGPVENYARAQVWQQFGDQIAEQTLRGVQAGLQEGVAGTKRFFYGDIFEEIARGTSNTIDTLARLGLAIQGVQLLLGPLASAWSAAFNQIIGQNIRLQEVILSTQTTLASTGRVIDNSTGQELLDPLQKINALGPDVEKAIDNIRVRSLDLAGVTSQQIVDIFGVVATSISQVNGNIKDAEDLAISFTAALGTLGIPFYQARQEIGSILGGYITEDSLLAKRLQISNADINKARNSIDGVVGYLQKKLQVAVAGQEISAKSFSGVLSNIQEVFENIAQRIGEPLLDPIVVGLTATYNFLKQIQATVTSVGSYLARTLVTTLENVVSIFNKSNLVKNITSSLSDVTKPFRDFARAIELGLQESNLSIIDSWVNGVEKIPQALESLVNGLISLGNFLQLQLALITEPIIQLLDQTRERLGGVMGFVQGLARAPQFLLFEGPDAFSKGWDTIASTIQYAAQALSKFAVALVRLKIVEFTAQLRAAAAIFELFGSLILGKLNLAVSFFDFLGNIATSDVAKFTVSLLALNKLINNTEFFGLKGLFEFIAIQRPIFLRFAQDIGLFAKGFRDAGNIDRYVKSLQDAQTNLLKTQSLSNNPVIANTANLRLLTKELNDLRAAQVAAVKGSADTGLITRQAERIKILNAQLREANALQRQFTLAERAGAAAKLATGAGDAAAAQEALRQAGIVTSGAAAARAVSSALDTLGQKIGLSREQMKGLGGAFNVATKSLKTFLTASIAINVGFTALSIAISGVMSWMQQMEEAEKKRQMEAYRTAQVNKILASSYEGLRKAAAGGDIAAQRRLDDDREAANAAFQIQQEKKAKLVEEDIKLNNRLAEQRTKLKNTQKGLVDMSGSLGVIAPGSMFSTPSGLGGREQKSQELALENSINALVQERLRNKQQQAEIERRIYEINQAQAKVAEAEFQQSQFTILAERRRDIEQKIQDVRKDYLKELSDKEFQSKIEVLNIEQQKRREIQEKELSALRERFSLLANNATQQDQKIIQLVQDYEQALLEAANAEGARRAELVIKEQQLRKEIEDYAYKMAKEKVNLEKQLGNYQKEVEKWKSRQSFIRNRDELRALKQRAAIEADTYGPYSTETQQQFVNAAGKSELYKNGLSTPQIYALFQLFSKKSLGVSSDESAASAIIKLEKRLVSLFNGSLPSSVSQVASKLGYTPEYSDKAASALTTEGVKALNLSRFYVRQDTNNLREPDISIDWAGMESRMRKFGVSVLDATKSLQEAQKSNDEYRIAAALNKFSDPSVFTEFKSDYTNDLALAKQNLGAAVADIVNLSNGVQSLDAELDALNTRFLNTLRTVLKTSSSLTGQVIDDFIDKFAKGATIGEALRSVDFRNRNERLKVAGILDSVNRGYTTAFYNTQNTYDSRQQLNAVSQVEGIIRAIESRIVDSRSSGYQTAIDRFTEALRASSDQAYSLAQAQANARREVSAFVATEIAKFKGSLSVEQVKQISDAAAQLESVLLKQAESFDPFNKALESYTKRLVLAQNITDAFVTSTRTLFNDLVSGQKTVKEAFSSFSESLNKELAGIFIDSVMETYRKQVFDQITKILGVPNLEEQARQALSKAGVDLQGAAVSHNAAATALNNAATAITNAANGTAQTDAITTPPSPGSSNSPGAEASKVLNNISEPAKETGKWLKSLSAITAAAIPAIAGFGMAIAGVDQMKKGGTYNTLMGLASIFGSIGSLTGMFGTGGLFAPKARATGGPAIARQPYLVGERGPELFFPEGDGRVVSNARTQALLASRGALQSAPSEATSAQSPFSANREAIATTSMVSRERQSDRALSAVLSTPPKPLDIRYESRVINGVEYVTAEQFQQGMRDAAERGRAMTLKDMRNSVKVRKQLGMG